MKCTEFEFYATFCFCRASVLDNRTLLVPMTGHESRKCVDILYSKASDDQKHWFMVVCPDYDFSSSDRKYVFTLQEQLLTIQST